MKHQRLLIRTAGVTLGLVGLGIVVCIAVYLVYDRSYRDRLFPGVRVLGLQLQGLTPVEADQLVNRFIDEKLAQGLIFQYNGQNVAIPATIDTSPDVSRDLIVYDVDAALKQAFATGRTGGRVQQALARVRLRFVPKNISIQITLDRETLAQQLETALQDKVVTTRDASFVIQASSTPQVIQIEAERTGSVVRMEQAFDMLERQAHVLDFSSIQLTDESVSPRMTRVDLEPLVPQVEEILARPLPVFTYETQRFSVSKDMLASWIVATSTGRDIVVTLDPGVFGQDLPRLAPGIEQEAKNGSLEVKDGKIVAFVAGQNGREIDRMAMHETLLTDWPASSTFPLIVRTTEATLVGEDPERLGIRELLGVGTSNFSGSPTNRRKNIALGIARVHGSIIQPGETFSLLQTLGPVDGAHQWLPELVIKGNETKPEYGGGLCQIGTTTFRGALAAGLRIIERQNHSYRVRYYEPAGTDATIYEPKPDFRFLNDMEHPVLINAYSKGDQVFFEFWGTKDGRTVEQTTPRIYNITSPPPMKLVETLDLPVGKKKCTETAHAGADAEFTYTVTYATGATQQEVFRSHYRPWQAVCLIGVEKLSDPVVDQASSTIPIVP